MFSWTTCIIKWLHLVELMPIWGKKMINLISILYELHVFGWNTGLCESITLHTYCFHQTFSFIQKWKFASRIKFEDVKDIKRNMTMQFPTILKEEFQRRFHQWKIWWNKCVQSQGVILKKIMFHLSLISVFVNATSILMLSEPTWYTCIYPICLTQG